MDDGDAGHGEEQHDADGAGLPQPRLHARNEGAERDQGHDDLRIGVRVQQRDLGAAAVEHVDRENQRGPAQDLRPHMGQAAEGGREVVPARQDGNDAECGHQDQPEADRQMQQHAGKTGHQHHDIGQFVQQPAADGETPGFRSSPGRSGCRALGD